MKGGSEDNDRSQRAPVTPLVPGRHPNRLFFGPILGDR